MDAASVQAAYARWSRVYDGTFGMLMNGARRRAVGILNLQPGERALEVGVGTGLSLPLMPAGCHLTGVDFSRPMLERALPRVRRGKLACRAALVEADGARLPFADGTFDAALAPFVVSATPNPAAVLREMVRVCRPGGRLLVLNHFTSRSQFLARIEQGLSPVTSSVLGFHTDFPLEPLFESASIKIDRVQRVTLVGSWYAVTFMRRDE